MDTAEPGEKAVRLPRAAIADASEELLRLVVNAAPVMIWISDADRLCTYFNQRWLDFTGRPLDAERGNGWADGVHADDLRHCLDTRTKAFDQREAFQIEYRLRRGDGRYRWILDSGVPTFDAGGFFVGYIGSAVDVTQHKLAEAALSTMSQQLIRAQERERTWIARELHDDITQRLALLGMHLDRLQQRPPVSAAELTEEIRTANRQVADLVADIQVLSHRLHSSKLELLGLEAAAAGLCVEISARQTVKIDFHCESIPKTLPWEISLCLYRVLQESLQNAMKHSGSRHFQVFLKGGTEEIELTVKDSGTGFELEQAFKGHGIGLSSMKERLKPVNGMLSIDSELGVGTRINARVPLSARARAIS